MKERFDRELLKGNTLAMVLAALADGPLHGYQIAKEIVRRSDDALSLGQGVLYPILHRMERDGLIEGTWEAQLGRPNRRRYQLTAKGERALHEKAREWQAFTTAMGRLLTPVLEHSNGSSA